MRRIGWLACASACVLGAAACRSAVYFDDLADAALDAGVDSEVDSALDSALDAGPGDAGIAATDAGCASDDSCPLATLHCDLTSGACFGCVVDADCTTPGLPRCDGALHRCIECGTREDCAAGRTCELLTRRCIQMCASPLDCTVGRGECDLDHLACEECELPSDCAATPDRPVCEPRSHVCVGCTDDSHCTGDTPHCDRVTGRCAGCTDDTQCGAGTPLCDPVALACAAAR